MHGPVNAISLDCLALVDACAASRGSASNLRSCGTVGGSRVRGLRLRLRRCVAETASAGHDGPASCASLPVFLAPGPALPLVVVAPCQEGYRDR